MSRSNGPAKTSRSSSSSAALIAIRLEAAYDATESVRPSEPHRLAHVGQGLRGDGARLLGPAGEGTVQRCLVRAKLGVALARRREVVDDGVGDRGLEVPVARAVELALDLGGIDFPDHGEDVDEVGYPRLVLGSSHLRARVGYRAHHLLARDLRLVEDENGPALAPPRGGHLRPRALKVHDPRPNLRDAVLGHDQRVAEAHVEAARDLAHQLDVLLLVLPHGDVAGAVEED